MLDAIKFKKFFETKKKWCKFPNRDKKVTSLNVKFPVKSFT